MEHLIDREKELQILRRLARKNIGPRLLGTFVNGRFEEFFHARTLTPRDLRNPATSKQIAKRMRELHDGIELLKEERDGGPTVWKNWDNWVERTAQVVSWTDHKVLSGAKTSRASGLNAWRNRGLICGVEWARFHQAVEKYRAWLIERLGGLETIKKQMVFAHNDVITIRSLTCFRNILTSIRHNTVTFSVWSQVGSHLYSYQRMNTSD